MRERERKLGLGVANIVLCILELIPLIFHYFLSKFISIPSLLYFKFANWPLNCPYCTRIKIRTKVTGTSKLL